MTTLPIWAVWLVGLGSPVLTLTGVLVAQLITRKSASELEHRSRREETMRVLRWAAEMAIAEDEARSALGILELNALGDSELLDEGQQLFVDAALRAVIEDSAALIEEAGADTEVVRSAEATPEGVEGAAGPA